MSEQTHKKWRWAAARTLNRSTRWCWADLVTWALAWHPFRGNVRSEAACVTDSVREGRCYCGKYERGCERRPSDTGSGQA